MRRLALVVILLAAVSLSTAFAASMDVRADNLSSTRTSVSISVPTTVPTRVTPFYLRNHPDQPPGNAVFVPGRLDESSTGNNSVEQKTLVRDALAVDQSHTDITKYHAWETVDQTTARLISGPATLYVDSNGGSRQMTAGLFECWKGTTTDPLPAGTVADIDVDAANGHGCVFITSASSTGGTSSTGYSERTVQFTIPSMTIEVGHRLRLKIVNNTSSNWNLQWGFNSARSSQLQVTES